MGGGGNMPPRPWPHAGQQSAPHMHVLVCICSNVRQFILQHVLYRVVCYSFPLCSVCSGWPCFVGQNL